MARDESLEETSGHSEAPIQAEVTFDPDSDPEAAKDFLEVVDSVDNETELSDDSKRILGEAVVTFSGTVRPKK